MDQLVYTYHDQTNWLKSVVDNAASLPISGNPDFRNDPGNNAQDYYYDVNGNIIMDRNKGFGSGNAPHTTYSLRNKPLKINFENGAVIEFTYDSEGNKVKKVVTPPVGQGNTEVWHYSNGFVFKGGTLEYILHPEGRVRTTSADFTYDFFLKDHLDNVRAVAGTQLLMVSGNGGTSSNGPALRTYVATMEVSQASTEGEIWQNIHEVRDVKPLSTMGDDTKAARLNAHEEDRRIGTALMLRVMPGDRFDISASSYYAEPSNEPIISGSDIAGALISALGAGTAAGVPVTELDQNLGIIQSSVGNQEFGATLDALHAEDHPDRPKSHLNWIFFDENLNPIYDKSGSRQASGHGAWATETVENELIADHPGYVLFFTDNTTSMDVYWDQTTVTVSQGQVLEEDHYYPFGLTLSENSYFPLDKNKYKLTTKELQSEFGLYYYDFGARMYDMQIGKWVSIDEEAEDYFAHSPYNYVGNNPVRRIDPDGRSWWDKVVGATVAVVDNASGGIVNLRTSYQPDDPEDYNQGQDVGEIVSIVGGAVEGAIGLGLANTSAAVLIGSGGTTAVVTGPGMVVGTAMSTHGLLMASSGAANFASQKGRIPEVKSKAASNRAESIRKGIPSNQIGPSGKPKIHSVNKPTLKTTKDAARNNPKSNSAPIKHTNDRGQKTHFHSTKNGEKLKGKDNVHYNNRSSKQNPKDEER